MRYPFWLIFSLCVQAGLAQKVTKSEWAAATDAAQFKTFGFFDIDTSGILSPENYIANIEVLKKAVAAELKLRGYTESTQPDVKINMGIVVVEKAQTRETNFVTDRPRYMGQRNYSWKSEEVVVGTYREGTLDFHLIDAATNKMLWWATVTDILPDKQKNMQKTIERGVKKMFGKFPGKG